MDNVNEQINAFLNMVADDENYVTKTIYGGQKTIALDKKTGYIHIINSFQGNCDMDFLTKDTVSVIIELCSQKPEHTGKGGRTGKHDRTSTEIYDGHILKYDSEEYPDHDEPYVIRWHDNDAGFTCENSSNFMLAGAWDQMEIIGHIRDNPELVKDSQREESDETDFRF